MGEFTWFRCIDLDMPSLIKTKYTPLWLVYTYVQLQLKDVEDTSCTLTTFLLLFFYGTNTWRVAMHLFNNWSQNNSKCEQHWHIQLHKLLLFCPRHVFMWSVICYRIVIEIWRYGKWLLQSGKSRKNIYSSKLREKLAKICM